MTALLSDKVAEVLSILNGKNSVHTAILSPCVFTHLCPAAVRKRRDYVYSASLGPSPLSMQMLSGWQGPFLAKEPRTAVGER